MQIAGLECAGCATRVQAAEDGTWCAACGTVLHRRCLEAAAQHCPGCNATCSAPEERFHFSERCPVCMRASVGRQPSCPDCGADTCWDTEQAYLRFRELHRRASRGLLLSGLGALAAGGLLLALFLGLALPGAIFPEGWPLTLSPVGWVGAPLLLLGILACGYGLRRALRGAALRGFR